MRSMFSNRYDNKRTEFYERYEAARALHPSLPEYERPVEPNLQDPIDNSSKRRWKSYLNLKNETREKFWNEDWLTSDRLDIVVRRTIEERNYVDNGLMPKFDSTAATHEFSHNGRSRKRGRRPNPDTVSRLISDFAQQVGGMPYEKDIGVKKSQAQVKEIQSQAKESQGQVKVIQSRVKVSQGQSLVNNSKSQAQESGKLNSGNSDVMFEVIEISDEENSEPNTVDNLAKFQKPQLANKPGLVHKKMQNPLFDYNKEMKENIPLKEHRIFICPVEQCQRQFDLRRSLSKHQRETGHHNWTHKCEKCGKMFRTEGFKRLHGRGACKLQAQSVNSES